MTSCMICWPEIFADAVAAQRQGQAGLFVPPHAQVDQQVQAEGLIGELAFMDDQPGVGFAVAHVRGDLVEVDDFVAWNASPRSCPRHSCSVRNAVVSSPGMAMVLPRRVVERHRLAGDDHRAVLVAHAAAATGQGVFVGDVGIGVDGDGGDLQLALASRAG